MRKFLLANIVTIIPFFSMKVIFMLLVSMVFFVLHIKLEPFQEQVLVALPMPNQLSPLHSFVTIYKHSHKRSCSF